MSAGEGVDELASAEAASGGALQLTTNHSTMRIMRMMAVCA